MKNVNSGARCDTLVGDQPHETESFDPPFVHCHQLSLIGLWHIVFRKGHGVTKFSSSARQPGLHRKSTIQHGQLAQRRTLLCRPRLKFYNFWRFNFMFISLRFFSQFELLLVGCIELAEFLISSNNTTFGLLLVGSFSWSIISISSMDTFWKSEIYIQIWFKYSTIIYSFSLRGVLSYIHIQHAN